MDVGRLPRIGTTVRYLLRNPNGVYKSACLCTSHMHPEAEEGAWLSRCSDADL